MIDPLHPQHPMRKMLLNWFCRNRASVPHQISSEDYEQVRRVLASDRTTESKLRATITELKEAYPWTF